MLVEKGNNSLKYYVQIEVLFNAFHKAHVSIGHGVRKRMLKEIGLKCKYITAEGIVVYLSLCVTCL